MTWDYQDALTRRLLLWSVLSAVTGAVLVAGGDPFARGFGLQALAWGAIDAAIALSGRRSANKRLLRSIAEGADREALARREAPNLRRLLWINAGLDVLYIAGGLVVVNTLGRTDVFASGNGWGVVAQGAFLFWFDLLHALGVPRTAPQMPPWDAFGGLEHRSFDLQGGQPAALLLHGFLGSPAEMRGLGEALHEQGWTVAAPLLPGFGAEVATLPSRRWQEWAFAAEQAADRLQAEGHAPLLLAGYSMGAALALTLANRPGVAGLALLAPFVFREPWWLGPAEFIVRPFLPLGFRPLRRADLTRPQLREGIANFMPGVDLDDPQVQATVRDFRVPLGLIDQVRGVSRAGMRAAAGARVAVLVVEGRRDRVARPENSARLIAKLPRRASLVQVDSDHDLTAADNPAFPQVRQAVLDFAAGMADHTGST